MASPADSHRPAMRVEGVFHRWSLFANYAVVGGRSRSIVTKNRLFKPFSQVNVIGGCREFGGYTI